MPKPQQKRQLSNILLVYIDTINGDTIKQVLCWILDPNKLTFSTNYFNSNNIIAENLSVKTVMEKVAHFIKSANETGKIDTVPDLVIWDEIQQKILEQYIPTVQGLIGHTTILRDRCRDIFKYDLTLQSFSLFDMGNALQIEEADFIKFAKIAHRLEKSFKDLARKLKSDVKATTRNPKDKE